MRSSDPRLPDSGALPDDLLGWVLTNARAVLREDLTGLYLTGSLVTGDFDPEISDIDLLAVTRSDISTAQFDRLDAMHHDFGCQYPAWGGRLEIAYVSRKALKTFRTERSRIAVISPGEPFHFKEAGRDWLINWWVARQQGVALFGPPAENLIDPISQEEFRQAVRDQVAEWQTRVCHMDTRPAQAYAILTMCRALYAWFKGSQVSKREASEWAAGRYPEWADLIGRAQDWRKAWRETGVNHAATFAETERFVRFTGEQIAADRR